MSGEIEKRRYLIATEEKLLLAGVITLEQFCKKLLNDGISYTEISPIYEKAKAIAARQYYNRNQLQSVYDFIVIGSGSSGAVVARRLAENPHNQVLLLEAGGEDDAPQILDPSLWYTNVGSERDWQYATDPSPLVNGRSVLMSMGKAVGGGSSINASYWVHGKASDFNYWAQQANDPLWGWEHVLSIYKKIENFQGPFDPALRGKDGLLWIEPPQNPNPLAAAIVKGAATLGIPTFEDNNGIMNHSPQGASLVNVRIKDGVRRNIPTDYLYPILDQSNITLLTRAEVLRINIDNQRATGVEIFWRGQQHTIKARHEIILSAGALNTPKILQLSGIGNEKLLKPLGIDVVAHLPGVGENLQDHPVVAGCVWEHYENIPPVNNICEATFFAKSHPDLEEPDLQPFLAEIPYATEENARLSPMPTFGWSLGPGLNKTQSVGSVKIHSNNPLDAPKIDIPFLKHPDDLNALVRGVEICRDIGNSAPLKPFAKREVLPGPLTGKDLEDFVRNGTITYRHEAGTARMGNGDDTVVNAALQVHGIAGLRIADASIMPRITNGNPMAPCVIIGERLAEIITGQYLSR